MRMLDRLKRRNSLYIFFLFLLFSTLLAGGDWCALQAQSRPPLVPSLRNDRRMAEEARRQAMDSSFVERPRGGETEPRPQASSSAVRPGDRTSMEKDSLVFNPNDSAYWAPTQVKQLGAEDYETLSLPQSSLDLRDPANVQTEVEYQPNTGYYVIHTKIGDVDIATPYLMTPQEYASYSEQQAMHQYWQQKIG